MQSFESWRAPIAALCMLLAACADDPESASSDPAAVADRSEQSPGARSASSEHERLEYPSARTVDNVDVYHGTEVADPYRWLEADVRESDDVAEWAAAQNAVSRAYLDGLPERAHFEQRLGELWNHERFGVPKRRGGRYFFTRNDGLQKQAVLYVQDGPGTEPRVLIDPNTWSDDGTVSLAQWAPGPDGKHVAYGVQDAGSDWRTWRVVDVDSGEVLDDELRWLKFTGVAWTGSGEGFYYSRYPAPADGERFQSPNIDQKVFFHRLGDSQADDRLVYQRPDHPDWGFLPTVSDDGRWLILTIFKGTDNRYRVALMDLEDAESDVRMLIDGFDHDFSFVGNDGDRLYFYTNLDAPRYRLVAIDVGAPAAPTEIIAEADDVLESVQHVGDRFVASYLVDAGSEVRIFDDGGAPVREVDLPGIGSVSDFHGRAGSPEAFFEFSSFNRPPTLYRYDIDSGERSIWREARLDFDPDDYTVRQVFYESADGTRVPMFIAHRSDVAPDGETATLLYGYGGFNIALKPSFSVTRLAWMQAGGVYAQANLRGGGEYGRAWHAAGTRTDKQNVFDDFIAAAEYLIETGITSSEHLGIYGRSNGGLLVGAVTNQRPELFAAALPAVGVMDMLRFDRFTAGRFWVDDYGSPEDPDEFAALYAYSPYHNIAAGSTYPAVLVTTADTDDRVVPAHSFKYAAALQATETGDAPQLIRIATRAGHGAGTPVQMLIDLYADQWAFLAEHTGLDPAPPGD